MTLKVHFFKAGGKWYTDQDFVWTRDCTHAVECGEWREAMRLLIAPSSPNMDEFVAVLIDDNTPIGFPAMLMANDRHVPGLQKELNDFHDAVAEMRRRGLTIEIAKNGKSFDFEKLLRIWPKTRNVRLHSGRGGSFFVRRDITWLAYLEIQFKERLAELAALNQ